MKDKKIKVRKRRIKGGGGREMVRVGGGRKII